LFSNAEHTLVKAKRDFDPDGWQIVYEWNSRGHLYDRYVFWLVVAVNVGADGSLTELEKPSVTVVELEKIERCRDDAKGPKWELRMASFEDGDWEQLVESRGDFAAIGLELTINAPVDRFATYWRDTRPTPLAEPPEGGMAFDAALRFMMQ
jgi:hypothetical protein